MSLAGTQQVDRGRPSGRGTANLDPDGPVRRSLESCRRITRTRARNFYYGLKLTPEPKRSALYAIYAFMRACDDLADRALETGGSEAGLERIEQFRDRMRRALEGTSEPGESGGPDPEAGIWPAFRFVASTYGIEPDHLHAMLDGQRDDMIRNRYETFEQLRGYCYKVAGVVGLVCIRIWGFRDDDPQVRRLAEERGLALQLTNILRDVVEDAGRDRVYLPSDELGRFDLDPGSFLDLVAGRRGDERFDRLMEFQIQRARECYESSASLESRIHADGRAASWAIMRIYRRLLERIAGRPRRVLTERVRLGRLVKAGIAMRATWRR